MALYSDKLVLYKPSGYGMKVCEKHFDRLQSIGQSNSAIAPCITYWKGIHRRKHHNRQKSHSSENNGTTIFVAIFGLNPDFVEDMIDRGLVWVSLKT